MPAATRPQRRYRGAPPEQRRAERRRRLLDTALLLYGADGPPASIETLCATARVSTGHFYELFRNRDELLEALFAEASERLLAAVAGAASAAPLTHEGQVRASVGAYVDVLAADERLARIVLAIPHANSDAMLPHRRATLDGIAAVIEAGARRLVDAGQLPDRDRRLTSVALVGACTELLSAWFCSAPRPPVEPVRDELIRLSLVAGR